MVSILYDMLADLWCLPFVISSSLQKSGADDTTDDADAFGFIHYMIQTDWNLIWSNKYLDYMCGGEE